MPETTRLFHFAAVAGYTRLKSSEEPYE